VSGLVVEALRKSYGDKVVLDGVSFDVPSGQVVAVLGPNGAGKTTTIKCVSTLLRPDGGKVTIDGVDVVGDPRRARQLLSVTGQFAALDEELSCAENLRFFATMLGLRGSARAARVSELVDRLSIADFATQVVGSLSGGQRRRVDIAVSLIVPPRLLILDEPTTGLDPVSRHDLWSVVKEVSASGTSVLLTTQYLEEADVLADNVVVINHGRVVASGTSSQLKAEFGGGRVQFSCVDAHAAAQLGALFGSDYDVLASEIASDVVIRAVDGVKTFRHALARLSANPELDDQIIDVGYHPPTLDDVFLKIVNDGHAAH
jgi:ABC-2 type transport system ATP-binding protein